MVFTRYYNNGSLHRWEFQSNISFNRWYTQSTIFFINRGKMINCLGKSWIYSRILKAVPNNHVLLHINHTAAFKIMLKTVKIIMLNFYFIP